MTPKLAYVIAGEAGCTDMDIFRRYDTIVRLPIQPITDTNEQTTLAHGAAAVVTQGVGVGSFFSSSIECIIPPEGTGPFHQRNGI